MFDGTAVRPGYEEIRQKFSAMTAEEMRARADWLSTSYLDQGITFAVGGVERPFPLDIMPRLIDAEDWKHIETGVEQRVRALEAFLDDIYDAGEAVRRRGDAAQGGHHQPALPAGGRRTSSRPTGSGCTSPGIDLIRDAAGDFRVLEDNVRVPSGVSYVMTNRRAMSSALPEVFADHRIRPVARYPRRLLAALRAAAPSGVQDPQVVVLTPGRAQLGLLRARAARPADGRRTGRGPRPGVPGRPGDDADHHRAAAGARDLPAGGRRVPRPGALPGGLAARLPRPDQRGQGRQRHHRELGRQRRRRRQARLHLRPRPDPLLPQRGADPAQRADLAASRSPNTGPR